MSAKFPWGKVIDYLQLDLDGDKVEVIKYYAKICNKQEWESEPSYHIEELHASYNNVQSAIIGYIAYKSLGLNQHALISGICRALCIT